MSPLRQFSIAVLTHNFTSIQPAIRKSSKIIKNNITEMSDVFHVSVRVAHFLRGSYEHWSNKKDSHWLRRAIMAM